MASSWTPERRARQSELMKQLKPWERSTGPKSALGKVRSSRNAWQGGVRPQLRELAQVLREQQQWQRDLL